MCAVAAVLGRKVRSALLQFRVLIITIESSHTYYLGVRDYRSVKEHHVRSSLRHYEPQREYGWRWRRRLRGWRWRW